MKEDGGGGGVRYFMIKKYVQTISKELSKPNMFKFAIWFFSLLCIMKILLKKNYARSYDYFVAVFMFGWFGNRVIIMFSSNFLTAIVMYLWSCDGGDFCWLSKADVIAPFFGKVEIYKGVGMIPDLCSNERKKWWVMIHPSADAILVCAWWANRFWLCCWSFWKPHTTQIHAVSHIA